MDGGLNDGLLNIEYDILPLNKEDKVPINIGIKIEIINALLFLIFITIHLLILITNNMVENTKYAYY